jgi:hypothetical protein
MDIKDKCTNHFNSKRSKRITFAIGSIIVFLAFPVIGCIGLAEEKSLLQIGSTMIFSTWFVVFYTIMGIITGYHIYKFYLYHKKADLITKSSVGYSILLRVWFLLSVYLIIISRLHSICWSKLSSFSSPLYL